jgi:hypothetical protein
MAEDQVKFGILGIYQDKWLHKWRPRHSKKSAGKYDWLHLREQMSNQEILVVAKSQE